MKTHEPLSIRQLEVFVTLVELGSFTRAARHLGLSQSTVSGHMADLEKRLGLRLAERDRSGVKPTAAGRALLPPARDTLRGDQHVRMAAAQLNGLLEGELILGGSTIPAVYVLPALVARFRLEHPGVTVRMITGDSTEIGHAVSLGDVDIGLVGAKPAKADRHSVDVRQGVPDELVLISPSTHPLASTPSPIPIEKLESLPFVTREQGSGTRATVEAALQAQHPDLALTSVYRVGSTEAVRAAVRAGIGFAFVSRLALDDASGVSIVPVQGLSIHRHFVWVTRHEDRMSPAARVFAQGF